MFIGEFLVTEVSIICSILFSRNAVFVRKCVVLALQLFIKIMLPCSLRFDNFQTLVRYGVINALLFRDFFLRDSSVWKACFKSSAIKRHDIVAGTWAL
jgi:hypothetical protein